MAEFAYNNKIHAATKISLFKANYGQDPRIGFEGKRKGRYEVAGKFVERMKRIQEKAKAVLGKAQEEMKKFMNRKHCKETKLQARIKPTALCSVIDKENSIESPLDFAILYIQLLSWLCILSPTVLMPVS